MDEGTGHELSARTDGGRPASGSTRCAPRLCGHDDRGMAQTEGRRPTMDTQDWIREFRALHTAHADAASAVERASEAITEAKKAHKEKGAALAAADAAVLNLEDQIASADNADLDALRQQHADLVASRDVAEAAVTAAAGALSAARREHKEHRKARSAAQERLHAFRRGQAYQPQLPGTEPEEAAPEPVIEVLAPKRAQIEAALRASTSFATAADRLKIDTRTLKNLAIARDVDLGLIGADLPRGHRQPELRNHARGGATA